MYNWFYLCPVQHCRNGWPKVREIYFDVEEKNICWREPQGKSASMFSRFARGNSSKAKEPNYMPLASITEIKRGIQTDIMKKVGLVDPECCLSLCNDVRTLDLTFNSVEDRNYFIRSLQALMHPMEIFMT